MPPKPGQAKKQGWGPNPSTVAKRAKTRAGRRKKGRWLQRQLRGEW